MAATVLVAGVLAACGSSAPAEITQGPTISPTGKHYSYSAAYVAQKDWPDPCALLTRSGAEAALDTTVSVRRFHSTCIYQPGSAQYPTLNISLLAVGTASGSSYRRVSNNTKGVDRSSVAGVGLEAYIHPVRHLPATRINVLTRYAHFSVTEQSPVGQQLSATGARSLLVSVAKVVARAFGTT